MRSFASRKRGLQIQKRGRRINHVRFHLSPFPFSDSVVPSDKHHTSTKPGTSVGFSRGWHFLRLARNLDTSSHAQMGGKQRARGNSEKSFFRPISCFYFLHPAIYFALTLGNFRPYYLLFFAPTLVYFSPSSHSARLGRYHLHEHFSALRIPPPLPPPPLTVVGSVRGMCAPMAKNTAPNEPPFTAKSRSLCFPRDSPSWALPVGASRSPQERRGRVYYTSTPHF